jgi:hypothetical protein
MFPLESILSIGTKLIDKLIPDPQAKAEANQKLAELALQGQLAELQADNNEADNISKRWVADLSSDSWLAKNIRPATLIYILTSYLGLAIADGYGFKVSEAYVTLLGQWGMLVMGAYFGGRTLEKIMEYKKK